MKSNRIFSLILLCGTLILVLSAIPTSDVMAQKCRYTGDCGLNSSNKTPLKIRNYQYYLNNFELNTSVSGKIAITEENFHSAQLEGGWISAILSFPDALYVRTQVIRTSDGQILGPYLIRFNPLVKASNQEIAELTQDTDILFVRKTEDSIENPDELMCLESPSLYPNYNRSCEKTEIVHRKFDSLLWE